MPVDRAPQLHLHGRSAAARGDRDGGTDVVGAVPGTPVAQGLQQGPQLVTGLGQLVAMARPLTGVLVRHADDDLMLDESLQTLGEGPPGHREVGLHGVEPVDSEGDLAQQQRPAVTEDAGGVTDGAVGHVDARPVTARRDLRDDGVRRHRDTSDRRPGPATAPGSPRRHLRARGGRRDRHGRGRDPPAGRARRPRAGGQPVRTSARGPGTGPGTGGRSGRRHARRGRAARSPRTSGRTTSW